MKLIHAVIPVVVAGILGRVSFAGQYAITDLGTLGGTEIEGNAINVNGQVAGDVLLSPTGTQAILYDGTTLHGLGTLPGADYSVGWAINASGVIAGVSDTHGSSATHAAIYDGTWHDLGVGGEAKGINDAGHVTGDMGVSGSASHAFYYDGSFHDLGTFGGTNSYGLGINNKNQISGYAEITGNTGYHAFFYNGSMHDLGTFGGPSSRGTAINNAGLVVGYSDTTSTYFNQEVHLTLPLDHAFLYDGTVHDLGTIGGANESFAWGVNNVGQVVGNIDTNGTNPRAFIYDPINGMQDLNTLIDPQSGWFFYSATGINDSGQITGEGVLNGVFHAFILTPVPEPASLSLLVTGFVFITRRRRTPQH